MDYASAFISFKGFKVYVKADKRDDPSSWKYGDLIYLDDAGFPHNLPKEYIEKAKKNAFKLVDLAEVE
jgi:hypothetical protein